MMTETRLMSESTIRWDNFVDDCIERLSCGPATERTIACVELRKVGEYIQDQVDGGYDGLLPLDGILEWENPRTENE